MKIERGNWQVIRACCTSGNCLTCLGGWHKHNRKWITHMSGLDKQTAMRIALNWRDYDAKAAPMKESED